MGSWLACAIILLLLLTMVAWVDKKRSALISRIIERYLFIAKKVQSNDTEMDIVSSLRL